MCCAKLCSLCAAATPAYAQPATTDLLVKQGFMQLSVPRYAPVSAAHIHAIASILNENGEVALNTSSFTVSIGYGSTHSVISPVTLPSANSIPQSGHKAAYVRLAISF